jgi:hypothetical protein
MFPRKTEHPFDVRVAILAKAPVAGLAKTRLIPHLGAEGAAALQRWLLQRTIATAVGAGLGPVTLWCTRMFITPSLPHARHSAPLNSAANPRVILVNECMLRSPSHQAATARW